MDALLCTENVTPIILANSVHLTLDVEKGENVICTFENMRNEGTIKIVKEAFGGNDTDFDFEVDGQGVDVDDFVETISAGTQTPMAMVGPTTVRTGSYIIREFIPSDWMHSQVTCNVLVDENVVGNTVEVSFDVQKLDDVICTFENMRNMGTIKIIKEASGGDDAGFGFQVSGTDSFSETLTAGDQTPMDMTGPVMVRTGFYEIWETIPPEWMHMGVTCNVEFNEDLTGLPEMVHIDFDVEKLDQVICTFENVRNTGTIKIIKEASGGDDTDFGFQVNGLDEDTDNFSETLTAGDQTPMDMTGPREVRTGTYSIWETIPDNWMHMDVTCNVDFAEIEDGHVEFEVEKDVDVICTFENVRNMGTIKIIKEASGGDDADFDFLVSGIDGFASDTDNFDETLTAGDQTPMDMTGPVEVRTGPYQIWETIPDNWMHMDVTCNVDFAEIEDDGHIEFEVIKNSDVICTFENVRNTGTIKIIKEASGGDDTEFNFQVNGLDEDNDNFSETLTAGDQTPMDMTGPVEVRTGSYRIWETIPDSWMHMDVTCNVDFEEIEDGHVEFEVEKDVDVICTFENVRNMGTIKIIKEASGGDDTDFGFQVNGLTSGTDNFSETLTAGDQTPMDMTGPREVRTGTYSIWETIPDNWMHMDVTCNVDFAEEGDGHIEFEVIKNSDVICTFENVRNTGTIKIIKEATGGSETDFDFQVTGQGNDVDSFSEPLTAGGQTPMDMTGPVEVRTGTYDVWETIPDGWEHLAVDCNTFFTQDIQEGSTHITFDVNKEDQIICTFENKRTTGDLKIIKNAIGGSETFEFEVTGDNVPVPLTGKVEAGTNGMILFEEIEEGLVDINEINFPFGFSLDPANPPTCDNGSGTIIFNLFPNIVGLSDVEIVAGETTTCTFNDIGEGDIRIIKIVEGITDEPAGKMFAQFFTNGVVIPTGEIHPTPQNDLYPEGVTPSFRQRLPLHLLHLQ